MKKMIFLMLILLVWSTAGMNAQLNIGSELPPKAGAILDLSQSGNLGLILPTVALSNVTHYQLGTANAGSDAYSAGAGTVVYSKGGAVADGIYIWDGENWLEWMLSPAPAVTQSSVTISPASYTFTTGGYGSTQQLSATVLPAGAIQAVTWNSLNESVATVDQTGLVTIINNGSADIQAISTLDPTVTGTAPITVNAPAKKLRILAESTLETIAAGSTSNSTYLVGTPVTAAVTPSAGFTFDGWYANGVLLEDAATTYQLTVPASDLWLLPKVISPKEACENQGGKIWTLVSGIPQCIPDNGNLPLSQVNQVDCEAVGGYWDGYACWKLTAERIKTQSMCESMGYEWLNGCMEPLRCSSQTSSNFCISLTNSTGCVWEASGGFCRPKTECEDYTFSTECRAAPGNGCKWQANQCIPK